MFCCPSKLLVVSAVLPIWQAYLLFIFRSIPFTTDGVISRSTKLIKKLSLAPSYYVMLFLLFLLYSTLLHRLLYRVEVSNKTEGYILIKWKHYWIKCNNKWAWNDLPWMPGFWRIGTTKLHLRCLSYWRWAFMGVFREKWFGASFSKKLILTLDFKWFYSEYHNPLRNK